MRRKQTVILPLYFACSILLAFVVFPHHHHDNFICFNTQHCLVSVPVEKESNAIPHTHNAGCVTQLLQTQPTESSRQQLDEGSDLPFFQLWGLIAEKFTWIFLRQILAFFRKLPTKPFPHSYLLFIKPTAPLRFVKYRPTRF